MEPNNTTAETCSTNESQDISSSQQESTVSDGPYGYDDGNESSSLRDSPHEEVVNSAIMEVSGDLMLGKLTPNKHPSVGSESSDISDDDARLHNPGGAIAKYPESSTGLSDNDWNPYATESDTNQTPRSPRSNTSEDNKVGFVSKANINVKAVSDKNRTPVTAEVPDFVERAGQKLFTDKENPHASISVNSSYSPEQTRSDNEDIKQYASLLSEREDLERESPDTAPDTARSAYTEDSRSGRQSSDSLRSEEYKRESIDLQALQSEPSYTRQSLESGPLDNLRRISAESARSIESGDNSSQPSVETVRNVRSSPLDLEKTAESNHSGRHSVESYHSHLSDRSRKSDLSEYTKRSNPMSASVRGNRSDRLELLSNAAGDSLKELMQFESSQRPSVEINEDTRKKYPISSTRLTAKVQSHMPGDQNPSGYITVAERERLISESPVQDHSKSQNPVERRSYEKDRLYDFSERSKPVHSETNLPFVADQPFGRSPSEVSMRRVSNLFEETKRQVREAVALQRPDPSGSEERFPLRERLSWNQHDASFIPQAANYSGELEDKNEEKLDKSRESEAARSLTSEEVARVLSKYSEFDKDEQSKLQGKSKLDSDSRIKVSAFDSVERSNDINGHIDGRGSDDELTKRVRAILANSNTHTSDTVTPVRETRSLDIDYTPNTIDYSRLHRDLEEIQDSLHDIPKAKANDSLPLHLRNGTDYKDSPVPAEFVIKSMETTGSGVTRSQESGISEYNGRESGASEYGRRLVWDHGADLQYDQEYDGKFLGTNTSSDTLSQSRRKYMSEESDTLVVRPDSVMTNGTDNDLESEGTKTLTGSDITRAERLVKQVLNRQAEGDLKENVEDIIARYRDEKKDLYDRYQSLPDSGQLSEVTERGNQPSNLTPIMPLRAELQRPVSNYDKQKEIGLAERVYKILSAETDNPYETPNEQGDNKGMATTVSNILARGRPQEQVNGILTEALTQENEMLKKIAARDTPRITDSSLEDSGVNDTEDSITVEDGDIRKRLQWSQLSSPEKGNKSYMSDFSALREVTKAPYSSVNNAKTLLSTQLKKMSERNFDKSIELRTPFRQTVECWPVHGVERTRDAPTAGREAWMPRQGSVPPDNEKKTLGSERFYITDKDHQSDMRRHRTYSDPFEVSQSYVSQSERDPHPRSRSEEPHDVSDLSQYSELPRQYSPTARRTASSPTGLSRRGVEEFMTPKSHKPEVSRTKLSVTVKSQDTRPVISPTDSDTSGSRRAARPRPYRPAGRGDMYYTESGDDTNESGTTIESTHPGSDDAVPPYIPRQYLGSRKDEPNKHPTGIYGVNNKPEDLSTIDENSVKDDKEKALSVSTGSNNKGETADKDVKEPYEKLGAGRTVSSTTQLAETGYQTRSTVDAISRLPDTRTLDSGYPSKSRTSSDDNRKKDLAYPGATGVGASQPMLKSREEFLREFEKKEQERRRYSGEQRDQMGTSVRSDPGGTLEDMGPRREYRESADRNEFQVLEPEPGYPQERLRYSRSRSDTDLVALSPAESQKYSSPMQPGTRFMELSTQPSPIFHQDSLTIAPRRRTGQDVIQGQTQSSVGRHSPPELPRVDDRQRAPELPQVDDRSSSEGRKSQTQPEASFVSREEPVRPLEPGITNSRSNAYPGSQELMNPVDLGADPGRLGGIPRSSRPRTPVYEKEKEMEAELEKMNKELSDQVKEIQEGNTSKSEQNVEDTAPLSKKAQILRQVLEQEYVEGIPPNINDMWTRFKEKYDQSVSESSMGSTRLDALSGLIQNPTHHFVNSFLREKEEETEAQKKVSEERAEKIREERKQESERLKRLAEKRAADERSHRRLELQQKHGLSEEESNGSITELLVENGKRKERTNKKDRKSGISESPKKRKSPDKEKRDKKGRKSQVDRETETNIKSREHPTKPGHSDTLDTLFSIPEDASFEQSPSKSESELRSRQRRQRHVIDPLMKKLRDKIKLQRDKIDKERRKELQRVEKLKKLEMLLNAKRKNRLSDKAIDVELQNVSSTTSVHSETTLMSTDNTANTLMSSQDSEHSSELSTTLKDSTATPIKLQVKRYPELEQYSPKKHYVDTDSTELSDFSNIIVEKVPENRSEKRKSVRNSASREKSSKLDDNGQRIRKVRKSGKKSKEVFGVEISPEDLEKQVKRYERYVSPERRRKLRDASTMYPSPITVSPPQQRRIRDVLMRSEAIQTSPSIRSSSPTYSYDEAPVAPVPTMSSISSGKKSLRRRPSPSPPRVTPSRATPSRSVRVSPPRRTSKSPTVRKSSKSPARPVSKPSARHSRPRKDPSMWKPECESTPPENSMFTPEVDENMKPASKDEATAWFIPMKPVQPWRQPLKERQAFSVRQENWEPTSVSQTKWKKLVHEDMHKEQGDPNDVSRDTKFDLDPEGQPINENLEEDSDITDLDLSSSKPLSKMSLQEAFMMRKQMTISRLRERQKRLNLAAEQRKMEGYLKMERDRLFSEERKKEANPEAHPYSENLYRPARRIISKEEMKELTTKRYRKLPEVIEKEKLKKREEDYSLNRLKARLFNRKIQKHVLVKAHKWGR